jgi:diguanylate cyclase (GGDEF)-like protein/PAS domain S-box-containing protein
MDQHILYWNKSAERLYGWTRGEALGHSIEDLLTDDAADFSAAVDGLLDLGVWSGEIVRRRKDGSTLSVESRWTLVRGDDGLPQSILAIDTDITERKAAEQEVLQLAFYDPLTLLPNRRLLVDRLQQALVGNARNQNMGALLFIDLDNFKTLNDTLGHDQGDLLLQQAAGRLLASVRASDTVARLGGDEFVVLLDLNQASLAETATRASIVGEKILAALSLPYQIADNEHHSSSSIGITLFYDGQQSVGELLKRADLAMYQAKAAGRNTMRFFDPEMQAVISARAALEADLRLALSRNELLLHYQPQVDGGRRMTGVEALLRWQHPRLGLVPPGNFIALAEESGLILPIGLWVLQTACAQLAQWAGRDDAAHLDIAVNVSVRQFRQADFVSQVMDVLGRSGADPHRLKLELTESLMVDDMEVTIAKMTALKAEGVSFSLDDFGTGYSSLAYLKRLPLDQLKIDQSFVKDVLTDPNDAAIARTVVALARSLGLSVIAEGVETEAQRSFLARHGCHACQGYLFSRPLTIDQLELFMQANSFVQ